MTALTEEQARRMLRIAQHVALTAPTSAPHMGYTSRFEAALTGITNYIGVHGWPDDSDFKGLFRAAAAAIAYEARHSSRARHLRFASYWHHAPAADVLAEEVTDAIAVHQLLQALTDDQVDAIQAVADVMGTGGGMAEAAEVLGITTGALSMRLTTARRTARALWIASGDTPRGHYHAGNHGKGSRLQEWRYGRRRAERVALEEHQ